MRKIYPSFAQTVQQPGVVLVGANYLYAMSEGVSSITGTLVMQNKVEIITPSDLPLGDYRVCWCFNWQTTSVRKDIVYGVYFDGDYLDIQFHSMSAPMSDEWYSEAGFKLKNQIQGQHTLQIRYGVTDVGETAYIKQARMELWRIN